jgi:predicted RNase H-like HicB family nuclease
MFCEKWRLSGGMSCIGETIEQASAGLNDVFEIIQEEYLEAGQNLPRNNVDLRFIEWK